MHSLHCGYGLKKTQPKPISARVMMLAIYGLAKPTTGFSHTSCDFGTRPGERCKTVMRSCTSFKAFANLLDTDRKGQISSPSTNRHSKRYPICYEEIPTKKLTC